MSTKKKIKKIKKVLKKDLTRGDVFGIIIGRLERRGAEVDLEN